MERIKRVAIIGVTGLIGRGLPVMLAEKGISVTGVSRNGGGDVAGVSTWQTTAAMDFAGHDAVINLAGEPIAKRWSAANRRRFYDSRAGLTSEVVKALASLPHAMRPRVLVNASAVGIYGDRGDEVLTEASAAGTGYLADICTAWERAADAAAASGVRVVKLRTGIVLGREGDAFQKLRFVFKCGIAGRLGSGKQWMPWIHLADQRAAVMHAVFSNHLTGAVNVCAPQPVTNREFTRQLAAALSRPAILPVPGCALKLALGGFGGALLEGQRTWPAALEADGFTFRYPSLDMALADLVG